MRAILSVYDKSGIEDLARGLQALGWELYSTGGTLRAVQQAGVAVTSITELTGSPEMLEGRVKTLHPLVHGGLLYRRGHPGDEAEVARHGIRGIDLVAGNLYPFEQTVAGGRATLAEALEQIDIGGPTMIRAAAKNHPAVIPLVDPADYSLVLEQLWAGGPDAAARRALAAKAFAHVARYDTLVAEYLRGEPAALPAELTVAMTRRELLRYGENPHQRGAFYAHDSVLVPAEGIGAYTQHHGKALSFVNILDADAAYNLVLECEQPAVAIIKHTNPCCFAAGRAGAGMAGLYERALTEGDCLSAYGGIVAINRPLDMDTTRALRELRSPASGERMFYEIVVAPGADPEALEHLKKKSQDLRILTAPAGDPHRARLDFRAVRGGVLVQEADVSEETRFEVVSERQPTALELADLALAWKVCKHVKSNAVAMVRDGVLVGMGAGQPNRAASARIAGEAAGERARGAVAATDALIPFPDTVEVCAAFGVSCVMHTGGSIRDDASVVAANRLGVSLLTTGVRHFRH
ncbi:MAG: bifunctional phosphoribosylaminoimidazolecarboxamide formyltransferase/IMP cyclohydrolase [Dehalococcoidia bacterium]|nr:bifunctional phosphoribosylaminoimidazolecarboxamide formyltransferase/IMP cyclohydrolase [Dehalococcoidia bacterium]